jgi:glycosyltransferase involved in cell wall biosynthesis
MKKNLNKFKKKINIYINNHPEWGGTFQYTNLIIKAIESKFDKSSINFYFANKSWSKEFSKKGNFINLNFFSLLLIHILIFVESKKLARFISKFFLTSFPKSFFEKDQIWLFPSQDILSVICSGKTIVWINDLMHRYSNFKETSSFFREIYRDYLFKKIAKRSYRVLVDSKLGKKHVQDSYGTFNNIRVQYFSALKMKFKKSKNTFGKYLIYPAQFWEHKNHIKLLLAIKIFKENFKDIKLILIGHKKKKFAEIKKICSSLNLNKNVIFLGFVSEQKKIQLISNARALINPSVLGPTNIPQLEAFNYGCPVLLSNIFAAKEQCANSVIYFNPYSEKSIANSINKIWNSDKTFLLYKKRSILISKKYSFENYSKNLIKNIF